MSVRGANLPLMTPVQQYTSLFAEQRVAFWQTKCILGSQFPTEQVPQTLPMVRKIMDRFRLFGGSDEQRSCLAEGRTAHRSTQVASLPHLADDISSQTVIFRDCLDAGWRAGSASEADFQFFSPRRSGNGQGISTQGPVIFTWIPISFGAHTRDRMRGQVSNRHSQSAYRRPPVQEFV
jgi:hypothetical protein